MASSQVTGAKSTGEVKALLGLQGCKDLKRLQALTLPDVILLSQIINSGASPTELVEALKESLSGPVDQLVSQMDRMTVVEGKKVQVTVLSYLTNSDLRGRYPVSEEIYNQVETLKKEGKQEAAVSTLQGAITRLQVEKERTKEVQVTFGQVAVRSAANEVAGNLHKALPPGYRAAQTTALEDERGIYVPIKGYLVRGPNQKITKMVARLVNYYVDQKRDLSALYDVPTVKIVKE